MLNPLLFYRHPLYELPTIFTRKFLRKFTRNSTQQFFVNLEKPHVGSILGLFGLTTSEQSFFQKNLAVTFKVRLHLCKKLHAKNVKKYLREAQDKQTNRKTENGE